MNLHNLLTKILDRRPRITVVLQIPEEIINNGKYNKVTITTDAVQFHFTHGIIRQEYFFKGLLKVELEDGLYKA